MPRNPNNTNQHLYTDPTYLGLPIMVGKGPMIENYLQHLYRVTNQAMNDYSRVLAFRVDLRFPFVVRDVINSTDELSGQVIARFIDSFKAKIRHNRQQAKQQNPYAHDSAVRYVWAREVGAQGQVHFHVAFLLNYNAFCSLGKFESGRDNMFNRLQEAWASALGLPVEVVMGLVEIPSNSCYRLGRGDGESVANFFFRASYLCKAATKVYGGGHHGFGASRI